ncbi:TetR/AcrR family transcriptional regulator [Paenibacillus sp. GbtcB18]|uniref:TetR/AcrR family transcriptional regulator n=1 Tax=Paenibacillus sp. GbtcB18 TaxID=2824763 RepID=UPI001C30B71D|nr:TetR/AcrR family transcriptional regulator [Paenibacillus sp. GbtcB18]
MARRRLTQEERRKETRQLLLESAVETFAQLGFHGASVDKIAEFAGFSKGAVYAHFQSKEELFLAILEQQMQLHVYKIKQVIEQQHSLTQFIETMDSYFDSSRQESKRWSMLNMEFLLYAMREESARVKWSDMITQTISQISKSIGDLLATEKHGATLSADEMAWTLLSLENGMAVFYYISGDHVPLHLYGKALQNIFQFPGTGTH